MKHVDSATAKRDKLQFARVQIEVMVEQSFPDVIKFINERREQMEVRVEYEWRPVVCAHCKGVGHEVAKCKKITGRRVWVPRQIVSTTIPSGSTGLVKDNTPDNTANNDSDTTETFTTVSNPSRRVLARPVGVNTVNQFQALDDDLSVRSVMGDINQVHAAGGGNSSGCNG
ncbi:uncharacterized protein [Spinacia oleracea]|uniref:DUF4283 domain-containing protein n=1 Tax=Spinacia oleracea TaxID=3562 RepID=A0A9R0K6G5_SPIOL|nr:uncharacterized protein LOC110799376 [Spinacia oleracea]